MSDKDIISLISPPSTIDTLKNTLRFLTETLTGVAASDKKDFALSIGYLFQRLRGGNFLKKFIEELDRYRKKGKIKDDYFKSEQHQACLQEMLDFLDKDSPDEIRFSTMKKVFLVAATEEISNRDSILPQQYMWICRGLSSGEILVLGATHRQCKNQYNQNETLITEWLAAIKNESGLNHTSLVEIHEQNLITKKLIMPRIKPAHISQVETHAYLGDYFRITDLGNAICQFIEQYESEPTD